MLGNWGRMKSVLRGGKQSIRSSTSVGVERFKRQKMHDSVGIPNTIGNTGSFVIITGNRSCPKTKSALLRRKSSQD